MPERVHSILIFVSLIYLYSGNALSAQLLPNGGFEKGKLENWENQSVGKGSVEIVQRDSCFSPLDTREIQVRGRYAARLGSHTNRSSLQNEASFAALRSSTFVTGDGFAFIALRGTENSDSNKIIPEPELALQLEILDAQTDYLLVSQSFTPSAVQLYEGCPSTPVQGRFSSHYFDTRSFSGVEIKIQFKQIVDSTASQRFTLIDQLVIFQSGEQALFFSRPYAQAGISVTSSGIPYLDSRGSFDPDRKPSEMGYSWWLKDRHYDLAKPCLFYVPLGSQQAVLYVNDGQHAISDSLQFYLHTTFAQADLDDDLQCDQPIKPIALSAPVPIPPKAQKLTQHETSEQVQETKGSPAPNEHKMATVGSELEIEDKPLVESIGKPAKIKTSSFQTYKAVQDMMASESILSKDVTPAPLPTRSAPPRPPASINAEKPKAVLSPKLTELNLNAYNLAKSGIHWEPRSPSDGNLQIITPAYFTKQVVKLIDSNGVEIETATYRERAGTASHYAFSQEGAAYPLNCILRVGNTDYLVKSPAKPVN